MDFGLCRKFKLGRNNLSGSILSQACPKWTKTTEFQAFRAESQILGQSFRQLTSGGGRFAWYSSCAAGSTFS